MVLGGRLAGSYLCLLYIASFSFGISAFNITEMISHSNTTNASKLKLNSGFGVCDSPKLPTKYRPTFKDCSEGIRRRLSLNPDISIFHVGGVNDDFRLPSYKYWSSCNITVGLGGGHDTRTEVSTWLDITLAAIDLNEICNDGEFTGGKIMTGLDENIWIKLSKVDYIGANEREIESGGQGRMFTDF